MTAPNKGWIVEAAGNVVRFVGEETKIGGLLKRSLIHIEHAEPQMREAVRILHRAGNRTGALRAKRLHAEAPLNEQWARELRESDHAALNAHALVAIWGAVEVCLEDTIVSVLQFWPDAPQTIASLAIAYSGRWPPTEEEARRLYPRWPPQTPPPVAGSNSPTSGGGTGGLYWPTARFATRAAAMVHQPLEQWGDDHRVAQEASPILLRPV